MAFETFRHEALLILHEIGIRKEGSELKSRNNFLPKRDEAHDHSIEVGADKHFGSRARDRK